MSFSLVARIWEYRFQPNERTVLQALADHADANGGSVRPSVARIAWKTDYSERQVQRVMKALVQRRVLIVVQPASGRRPTEYRIDLDAAERKPTFATERGDTAMSPRQDVTPDKMSPIQTRRDDNMSPLTKSRGDICDGVGVTFATERGDIAVSPEHTREQTIKKKEIPLVPNGTSPAPKKYPDDFEQWWRACPPLMRRCGKGDGYEAWRKAKGRPPLAEMLAVLAFQAESYAWTKEGGKYIPMATTYLNRSRWDAEADAFPRDGPSSNGGGRIAKNLENLGAMEGDGGYDNIFAGNGRARAELPAGAVEGARRTLPPGAGRP